MKMFSILMMAMCIMLPLSACESGDNPNEVEVPPTPNPDDSGDNSSENTNHTAVTLSVGDVLLKGYLNDNNTAIDLIGRLPVTVHLNRGAHDYCGSINPALAYDESDVQHGWKNGDLAFWTVGNDFVIFHSDEETSSSIGDIVNIGHLTTSLETVRNLGQNITVTIALDNDNNSADNETTTQMNITVNGHTLTATLEDNVTAQAFAAKLPITLPMMDLYGREMCYRFPEALPTDEAKTRGYEVGEIVYYPPMHSFVIMYKQNGEHFQMQSIGRVQGDVSIFDGIGDVSVTFTKADRSTGGKVLVAYFSRANYVPDGVDGISGATNKAGNTQTVAQYIKEKTGGTLFEIIPERNYPVSHTECSAIAQRESENNERPALKSHVEKMDDYDIVFVGFPIWVYREPMAVLTFLEEYDFKGKTVIPFCTSMAVAISASEDDFKKTLPNTTIKSGLRINYTLSGNWQAEVDHWIDNLGIK